MEVYQAPGGWTQAERLCCSGGAGGRHSLGGLGPLSVVLQALWPPPFPQDRFGSGPGAQQSPPQTGA